MEGMTAAPGEPQNHTIRPPVGGNALWLLAHYFRCPVTAGARPGCRRWRIGEVGSQPKVCKDEVAVVTQQNVRRLDVAVEEAEAVHEAEAEGELRAHPPDLFHRQATGGRGALVELDLEGTTRQEREGEHVPRAVSEGISQPAQERAAGEAAGRLPLHGEMRGGATALDALRMHKFECKK